MVSDHHSICSTRLSLSLGSNSNDPTNGNDQRNKFLTQNGHLMFPSLTLGLSSSSTDQIITSGKPDQASSMSAVSNSFSNSSVKRERDQDNISVEEVEVERIISSKVDHQDQDEDQLVGPRKKLRLTKEQSLILEDSFKEHTTLNPKQKQALAKRLNLRPRQVEVWFQNRRARTKLKQTEVDYEILKKCCETLKEENRRLHKELQELKAMKLTAGPLYMQLPAATLSMCPSCERITGGGGGGGSGGENSSNKISFSTGTKPHFYGPPFANTPAAC